MVNKVLIEIWGYEWNPVDDRSIDQRSSYKDHHRGRRRADGGANRERYRNATRRASWTDATTHRRAGRRRACNRTFAQWHVRSGSVAAEVSRPPAFTGAAVGASCSKHTEAKTQLLRIRIEGKQRKLVRRADVDALIEGICGVVLTHLSGLPARCAPRGDLAIRRRIEQVVYEVRTEIANVCQEIADKCDEPPLSEQD
jgi:hypothetical protein